MDLIGLDIGTTGCKAALFHDDGTLITSASREYAVDIPHPQWAEQDAGRVWSLAQEALRQVITQAGVNEVAAIGLSVQGEAVAPADAQGRALRPMILGMDTRTDAQNARLTEQFGAEWLFEHTGMPVHTINTLPKLLWLKEHDAGPVETGRAFLALRGFSDPQDDRAGRRSATAWPRARSCTICGEAAGRSRFSTRWSLIRPGWLRSIRPGRRSAR